MTNRCSPTTTSRSKPGVVIEAAETPDDGRLYLSRVEPGHVVLSTGEELITCWEKLHSLAEQIIQEGVAVKVRTWWTPRGVELVDLERVNYQPVVVTTPLHVSDDVDQPF
jgi:hypothetical protein